MIKTSKLAVAVHSAILFGGVVGAQTALAAEQQSEQQEVERIQVTGSKIKRIGATAPTPVVVIGRTELEDAGVSNVNDFLAELPSASVGLSPENSNNFIYANGLNTTDLRGLGSDRTLVLVNGRRFLPGQAGGNSVDLNNIATSFIERIEISTGGASAVYGADAVAGVVNIITRKSFDGIEIDLATTEPLEGGGSQKFGSLTFGREFDGGGFIFNYDYTDQEQMARLDKDWYVDAVGSTPNPNDTSGDDGIPARIPIYDQEHYGLYDESSEFFLGGQQWTFDENLNLRPFDNGDGPLPGSGLPGAGTNWYYTGPFGDGIQYGVDEFFRTPLERHTFNLAGHQEIVDGHDLSFDVTYSESEAFGQGTPIFLRGDELVIRRDNAFIKDDLASLMDENGVEQINMRRLSDDFGPRKYSQDRSTFRVSVGLDGYINDNWTYSTYFQHGEMTQDTSWYGEVFTENLFNALDAVEYEGQVVCADRNEDGEVIGALQGCAPINFLGKPQHSAEALEYISTVAKAERGHEQSSFGATVTGDLMELPAGYVSSAFTYEWRRESAYETPGTGIRKGLIFGNSGLPYEGSLTVDEYAAEFLVPLVYDRYLMQEVNLEAAYRYMDYSSTGTDYAYKLGFTWQVNDDIRVRFAKARSVRAPNIGELYSSSGTQYAQERAEPCAADAIAKEDQYKEQVTRNCAAAGIPEGWVPSDDWRDGGSLEGKLGGNPNLDNEVSNDITVGFVYTPSFLEGFDITVDYWDFEIENAIAFFGYEDSIRNCYRSESLNNPFCDAFTRDPDTYEVVDFYETSLNASVEKLSGVDIESVYDFDTRIGGFKMKLIATYLNNYELNPTGNAEDNRTRTGEQHKPRWEARFTTEYQVGDLRTVFAANYTHATVEERPAWSIEDNNYNDIPSYTTFDINFDYTVNDHVDVRLGVQNLADRTPPRNPFAFTDGEYYDVIGRRVTAGVNVTF
ncbi:TonB-dependent receptor domain-containing protein [Pseudoalteromonas ruthenica]|uniref:TonB-dependent receptor domain-containing protein n=1 Tax=Pseudoalteromonas ruthenica TaxID=151081 RepID=UPI0003494E54|nr:TonB-dependent receptor [Pseudoalteromonas ruthenica]